ncbi:universal stress protein [Chelativorans xinjiangense]|uniref:universal stress protein n=1 Tax=Chelativorans xinjiangense TaxID=2681485 RepID=UPI00135B7494|nr:universal stress protein [Chelativorans xinjiangense]
MYHRLLVPIDVQHNSSWQKALPVAVEFSRMLDAEINILSVVPDFLAGMDWRYAIRGETGGSEAYDLKDLMRLAEERLKDICASNIPEDLAPRILVDSGNPFEQIIETAADIDADLIVMAALRRSLKGYLLGPTTARVVRHADCSVHVVRYIDED